MAVQLTVSQVIDRPLAKVFHFYAAEHICHHPRWDPDMQLEQVSDGPIGVVTIIHRHNTHSGTPVEEKMEIVDFESNRVFGVVIHDGPSEINGRVKFKAESQDKTTLTISSEFADIGLGLWIVAATDVFSVGLVGFGITGIAHVMVNVSVTTTIQQYVAPEFRGRVTSFQLLGIMLALPIGAQLGGLAADFAGLPAVVAAFGGVQIACGLWAKLRMGGLREID